MVPQTKNTKEAVAPNAVGHFEETMQKPLNALQDNEVYASPQTENQH